MKFALTAIFCFSCSLTAQQPPLQTAGGALEKQRASIRKQVRATGAHSGFFTTSWMDSTSSGSLVTAPPWLAPMASGNCEPVPEATLSKLILQAAQREHVDTRVIRAVIQRESGAKPCAVSAKGAQGLMQLMPTTQIELGVQDPFDPESNISGGVRYLRQMLDRYNGNMALALAAYNAGPQRVTPGGKIPDIPETQTYVISILGQLNDEDPAEVK